MVAQNLHLFERSSRMKIEQMMYPSISKDEIEELIENNEIEEPIIQKINSLYNNRGIRQEVFQAVVIE